MSLAHILESIKEVYVTEVEICQNIMGMIYSVGKDTCRIVDEMKEILTLTFKITISIVTIIQDIEDIILELKDLSDMLHFSINSVDRSKVNDRLDHLKVIIAELRNKASQKHVVLDFLAMIIEDGLKMRYDKKQQEQKGKGTVATTTTTAATATAGGGGAVLRTET